MAGNIYLIQGKDQLVEMSEQEYDSEDLLQELLAKHPNLLAGDQMDDAAPRRWLLVSREMAVPSEENGSGRWSLDHLFMDQDAIPTLVEVKRSSDTRIRREVVGQMLDYAANAVVYWPLEEIRAQFDARCESDGDDSAQVLSEFLGPEGNVEQFWQKAKTNLQAGKVRMVFVADEVPLELRRIVEFLNEQMDPAEVLAVEIKQYVGQNLRTLVPRVFGQTAEAQQAKSSGGQKSRQWDERSFFQDLEARNGQVVCQVARKIYEWSKVNLPRATWGKGKKDGSFIPVLDHKASSNYPFAIYTYGRIEFEFQWMKYQPVFSSDASRQEFLKQLNKIPGANIPEDAIARRPSIALSILIDEKALNALFDALNWFVVRVKAS